MKFGTFDEFTYLGKSRAFIPKFSAVNLALGGVTEQYPIDIDDGKFVSGLAVDGSEGTTIIFTIALKSLSYTIL